MSQLPGMGPLWDPGDHETLRRPHPDSWTDPESCVYLSPTYSRSEFPSLSRSFLIYEMGMWISTLQDVNSAWPTVGFAKVLIYQSINIHCL